ncbi:MAG: hypothetical protein FWG87_14025 [Defluviitaleaceae bacterium]|nr:hypothetical protein [Defluviitaleaceae bacterium]
MKNWQNCTPRDGDTEHPDVEARGIERAILRGGGGCMCTYREVGGG